MDQSTPPPAQPKLNTQPTLQTPSQADASTSKINKLFIYSFIGLFIFLIAAGLYISSLRNVPTPIENVQINNEQIITSIPSPSITNTAKTLTPIQSVKAVNGNIVIMKNNEEVTITTSHTNSDPVISPDNTKVAYISTSEITPSQGGLKSRSTLVWIGYADTPPTQITMHKDFVFRKNVRWIDGKRLLYTDGEKSARVYNVESKTTQTVLGPQTPQAMCLDACGYETKFAYTKDYAYLVRVEGTVNFTSSIDILNLKTLKSTTFEESSFGAVPNSLTFPNNKTVTFDAPLSPEQTVTATVNLENGNILLK